MCYKDVSQSKLLFFELIYIFLELGLRWYFFIFFIFFLYRWFKNRLSLFIIEISYLKYFFILNCFSMTFSFIINRTMKNIDINYYLLNQNTCQRDKKNNKVSIYSNKISQGKKRNKNQ